MIGDSAKRKTKVFASMKLFAVVSIW